MTTSQNAAVLDWWWMDGGGITPPDPSLSGEFAVLSRPYGVTLDFNYLNLQFVTLPDSIISDPTLQTADESLYMYFNNF
jgi:hypothetical protein